LRRGFSLLILLAIMPMIFSISDQNTSSRTISFTATTTESGVSTVTSTAIVTTQVFVTDVQFNTLTARSLSLSPTRGVYGCFYDSLPFSATKGQRILGSMKSNEAVSFYLLSENAFNAWVSGGKCSVENDLARQENADQYALDVVVPADGKYELLFLNFASATSARITAVVLTPSLQVASVTTTMVANVSIPTSFTTTRQITFIGYPQDIDWGLRLGYAFLFLIMPVLILVLLIVAIRRRRAHGRKEPPALKQPEATAPSPVFCGECGAKLASSVKFCTKCGSPVNTELL
jgi:hypothetical protein